MTRYPDYCQLFDLDGAPVACGDTAEPSHIHIVRPSRRASLSDVDGLPLLADAVLEDDSAAA